MLAAILGLSPTALAILAAVCSARMGVCALHGQLFYFAGLLLYSVFPLSLNSLWVVPMCAFALFFIGALIAAFVVRKNIDGGRFFTCVLVLINFTLLLLLLHNFLNIMCFRLDEAAGLQAVKSLWLIFKIGAAALAVWLLLFFLLRLRRLGFSAIYAFLGLAFATYIVLMGKAAKVGWTMPVELRRALKIQSNVEYFTVAASAEFAPVLHFIPPAIAILSGISGYFLLKPGGKKARKVL